MAATTVTPPFATFLNTFSTCNMSTLVGHPLLANRSSTCGAPLLRCMSPDPTWAHQGSARVLP